MICRFACSLVAVAALALARQQAPTQEQTPTPAKPPVTVAASSDAKPVDAKPAESKPATYVVEPGTKILLNLLNSISTRAATEGDRVYLETAFPVLVEGRIVVPPGSYVTGTITQTKRPGKVKGRAELFIRFDALTLPNGVTRDFRARAASLDGDTKNQLDRAEGKIKGDSDKSGDAMKVGTGAGYGAMIGAAASGVKGAGIGAAAGGVAGLMMALLTRGPEAVLQRGSTVEMLLDRPLQFREDELMPSTSTTRPVFTASPAQDPNRSKKTGWPGVPRAF